jgi:hypothetical protein
MGDFPSMLDGANIVRVASLRGLEPSGRSAVLIDDKPIPAPDALAVCQYVGESDFYLFYCDRAWSVLGAGHFASLTAAISSAERAYPGLSARWDSHG